MMGKEGLLLLLSLSLSLSLLLLEGSGKDVKCDATGEL